MNDNGVHAFVQFGVFILIVTTSYSVDGLGPAAIAAACWILVMVFGTRRSRIRYLARLVALSLVILILINLRDLWGFDTRDESALLVIQSWGRISAVIGGISLLILTVRGEALYSVLANLRLRYDLLLLLLRPLSLVESVASRGIQALASLELEGRDTSRLSSRIRLLPQVLIRTITVSFLELEDASVAIASRGLDRGRAVQSAKDVSMKSADLVILLAEVGVIVGVWYPFQFLL